MSDLDEVKAILLNAQEYPSKQLSQSTRTMLADGLPHSLPDSSLQASDIHPFQKQFADCINEALSAVKTAAVTAVHTTVEKFRETEEQIKSAQVAKEAAATSNENANHEVKAETDAYLSAQAKLKETKEEHIAAEAFEKVITDQLQELRNKKHEVDALLTNMEKFEKSNGTEALDSEGVLNYLTIAKAESTLMAAVPSAMQIPPSARGKFDSLTWAEVRRIIESDAVRINAELASMETKARHATAEALGLWAIHDVAQDHVMDAGIILDHSKEAAQAANMTLEAAEAEVKQQQTTLGVISLQQASTEQKVQKIDAALAALERLRCPPVTPMVV